MIDMDAKSVADEIRAAEAHAALHHIPLNRMIQQYATKWYRDDMTAEPTPENHVFAWINFMEHQIAYDAPAALVGANWEKSHGEIAHWMEQCQERAQECYPITEDFRLWVRDALFGYGVLKVGLESTETGNSPFLMHVPMGQWGCACGPGVEHVKDSPLQYHRYDVDLNDLSLLRGADPAAVTQAANTYNAMGDTSIVGVRQTRTGDRKRCRVYDVWFPRQRMIGTLLASGQAEPTGIWLCPPRPWWGPKSGPFYILGFETVPGDPYPMSPVQPIMQQIEKLNAHLRAEAIEADGFKTGIGVDASAPEAAKAIEEGKANGIWMIPNLRSGVVVPLELGGVHPQRLEHTDRLKERVQRFLAMGDAQQGISNSQTATANSIAAQNADIRVQGMRGIVNHKAAAALKAQMWYRFYDNSYEARITITKPVTDPLTGQPAGTQDHEAYFWGGTEGGWYRGEFFPPQVDVSWEEDFTVTVDPDSTNHVADVQKQNQALLLPQIQDWGYNALQQPGRDVEFVIDKIGEALNIRNLFKQLFAAGMVTLAQQQNPMMPVQIPGNASPAMAPGLLGGPQAGAGRVLPPAGVGTPFGMPSGGPPFGPQARPGAQRNKAGLASAAGRPGLAPAGGPAFPRSAPANRAGGAYGGGGLSGPQRSRPGGRA